MKIELEIDDETIHRLIHHGQNTWSYWCVAHSLTPEGRYIVTEGDSPKADPKRNTRTFGKAELERALTHMAYYHPRQFGMVVRKAQGRQDQDTADVLVQLAAFGEVKYG